MSPIGQDDACYADGHLLLGLDSPESIGFDVESLTLDAGQESLHSSDALCMVSDVDSEPYPGQFSVFNSEQAEAESDISLCHSVSSLVDLVPSISTPLLTASSSMSSTVSSPDEITEPHTRALPLTSQERQAHYAWLDGIIGPRDGIQECVGTYKAFMEHQREVYYDRLCLLAEQPAVSPATKDFKSWVGGDNIRGKVTRKSDSCRYFRRRTLSATVDM